MYKHPRFSLDPLTREVWDENGKSVRVTGNQYRFLELLCQRHPSAISISDINLALDPAGAREYTEDHVRRIKNLIHTALNENIIRYKNRMYSLIGDFQKPEERLREVHILFDERTLRSISFAKIDHSLRIRAKTPGGGTLIYTNERFDGIL